MGPLYMQIGVRNQMAISSWASRSSSSRGPNNPSNDSLYERNMLQPFCRNWKDTWSHRMLPELKSAISFLALSMPPAEKFGSEPGILSDRTTFAWKLLWHFIARMLRMSGMEGHHKMFQNSNSRTLAHTPGCNRRKGFRTHRAEAIASVLFAELMRTCISSFFRQHCTKHNLLRKRRRE